MAQKVGKLATPMATIAPSSPPSSPKVYRKPTPMDPISANRVWKEHCDKCDAIPTLQGPFQIDPRTSMFSKINRKCHYYFLYREIEFDHDMNECSQ
jgi:hypothetical protein